KYNLGAVELTSITSFTHRDILVVRDAGALTASITGGSVGLPEPIYTLDAPLNDATLAQGWTQELRASGGKDQLHWVVGAVYSESKREYGQNLFVNQFDEKSGIPDCGLAAGCDVAPHNDLFYSALDYKLDQFAIFGEGTMAFGNLSFTAGLRYYHFKEDKSQ